MNYNKKIFLIVNIINELKTSNSQIQVVKINNYLQKLDKELEEEVKNTITLYYSDVIDSYEKLLYKLKNENKDIINLIELYKDRMELKYYKSKYEYKECLDVKWRNDGGDW